MGLLWSKLFRRNVRVLFLGLDAAGKTTLLYRLKLGEVFYSMPTIGFNVENFDHRNLHITAWDIGSRDKVRPLWRHYYVGSDAVVIVIDSTDSERFDELNHDITKLVLSAEELMDVVVLFLANKQDLDGALSADEISDRLNLKSIKHTWAIFPISAISGIGVIEAFDWMASKLGSYEAKKILASSLNLADIKVDDKAKLETSTLSYNVPESKFGTSSMDYCSRAYSAIKCFFFAAEKDET